MRGIILAGGSGTRLYPATYAVSKQLMPVYDKPMIYYPLSVLLLAGIREILLISTPQDMPGFQRLLRDGRQFGVHLEYAIQDHPRGLADAFLVGEHFIRDQPVAMILGDNIFFGQGLSEKLQQLTHLTRGAAVFGCPVKDPERYGVVSFDSSGRAINIEEKPKSPRSNVAVSGLYFYDGKVSQYAKTLKPSARGEIEISDLNQIYLERGELIVERLGRGFAWLDMGTHDSLWEAGHLVRLVQERQGYFVGCPEEIAFQKGWISASDLKAEGEKFHKTAYGQYLISLAEGAL